MLRAYPTAYEVDDDEVGDPDDTTVSAVLGKKHGPVDDLYDEDEQSMFDAYRARFKTSSKPAQHLGGLGRLRNRTLLEIGRAHVCTPVTNAHLVCRLLLENNKNNTTK